jgi:hypothetical protein
LLLGVASCGDDSDATAGTSPALQLILDQRPAPTDDRFEVFVCKVPVPTADPVYGDMTLRRDLDPADLANTFEQNVRPYFESLSHGLYHPTFAPGHVLTMTGNETHRECMDRALDESSDDAGAVIVVADAEHLESMPGGWGEDGSPCAAEFCPAAVTRRIAYVGASDFSPDWGPVPPLDLVEHEMGHTLGLPHSGGPGADIYSSDLDLMSNSAAPRDVHPDRRSAQDTIAINRLALGWLPRSAVTVVGDGGGRFTLSSSSGIDGLRLLVLPLDDESFLTVEYLTADGLDDFLPSSGLAVHRIDGSPGACGHVAIDDSCTGAHRQQLTLGSMPPHLDLLHDPGESWDVEGWSITARGPASGDAGSMQVEVHPTDG